MSSFDRPEPAMRYEPTRDDWMRITSFIGVAALSDALGSRFDRATGTRFCAVLRNRIKAQWPRATVVLEVGGLDYMTVLQSRGVVIESPTGPDVEARVEAMVEGLLAETAAWRA
jgi:hypothetical protein